MFEIIQEPIKGEKLIGNWGISPGLPKLIEDLYSMLDIAKPKRIVEIGTNAGHSAILYLEYSSDISIYTYDICIRNYPRKCAVVLKEKYGDRFDFEEADSHKVESIPECDLVSIDGDHSYEGVKNDVNLAIKAGAKYIILDDMNQPPMYQAAVEFDELEEVKRFKYPQHKRGRVGEVIMFKVIK